MSSVVELSAVTKTYRRVTDRTLLGALRRQPVQEVVAIDGLDLSIDPGQTLGVLGHNGAGKTTLLRLLAGVTAPSAGTVEVTGRVTPLIGVGVGFHPELSGLENIDVNGAVLGLPRQQRRALVTGIVDFSELEGVLDTPVKFYSSGMLLRLAFSIAVHTEPQILLVDELLAVGDIQFQQKCLARMKDIQDRGATVVLVSHSVFHVREVCDRAIVMNEGAKVFDGEVSQAIEEHERLLTRDAGAPATISDRRIVDLDGRPVDELRTNSAYELRCKVTFSDTVKDPHVRFTVYSEQGVIVYQAISAVRERWRTFQAGERAELSVKFAATMESGTYQFAVQLLGDQGRSVLAHDVDGMVTNVVGASDPSGLVPLDARARFSRAATDR